MMDQPYHTRKGSKGVIGPYFPSQGLMQSQEKIPCSLVGGPGGEAAARPEQTQLWEVLGKGLSGPPSPHLENRVRMLAL